jgi:chaperonin GroEL
VAIVRKALEEPIRQIVFNAGLEPSVVTHKVASNSGAFGFNALTNQYEDLIKAGVIDPTKVARTALENAASIAGLMLTTEAVVCDKPEKKNADGHAGMPSDMHDMY